MTEFVSVNHVLISVIVNAVGLVLVTLLRSAPPRLVLYLSIGSASAILVPWIVVAEQLYDLVISASLTLPATLSNRLDPQVSDANLSYWEFALLIWMIVGVVWITLTLLQAYYSRRVWRRRGSLVASINCDFDPHLERTLNRTRVYRLPDSAMVFSSGVLRPEIWIGDRVLESAHLRAALAHELCHITYRDQWLLIVLVLVERLVWWNPLVWLLGRTARAHMEYACDARCQQLLGAETYRSALLDLALDQRLNTLVSAMVRKPQLISRMQRMQQPASALKAQHIVTLTVGLSTSLLVSAQLAPPASASPTDTFMDCYSLIPEEVHIAVQVAAAIDTRDGQQSTMSVSMRDLTEQDQLTNEAQAFTECIQNLVGVAKDEWTFD